MNGNPKQMNGLQAYDIFGRISDLLWGEAVRTISPAETQVQISGLTIVRFRLRIPPIPAVKRSG